MAKKETKSDFLRKHLGKNPELDHGQINQRWTKAGHPGEISSALFYQVRSKMGIKTVWQWVYDPAADKTKSAGASPARGSAVNPGGSIGARAAGVVYQLKITLQGVKPPIWRRFTVPDGTLSLLHEVVQVVMGWQNCHLYSFEVGDESYTDPRGAAELDMESAGRVKLSDVIPKEKFKFGYSYDFGDGWEHEILVEKVLSPGERQTFPVCLDGARPCPPEDCGGIWGYADFLEAIADPGHENHEELLGWIGGEFDPEAFEMKGLNASLRRLKC